ncbi:hypothetical protein ACFL0M_04445 [Thermodesulfobacteriota bacterium]
MPDIRLSLWSISAIILCFTLLSHGLILANDGTYWDGWMLRGWQQQKDFTSMRTFYSHVGMPFFYYFHRFFASLPQPNFYYKVLSFISLYLSFFLVYLICQKSGFLTSMESLYITVLMICYPGQQMVVEPCVIAQYIFPLPFFFLACLLGLYAEVAATDAQWLMRTIVMFLFLISFNMNSLLVYYFGFLLLLLMCHIRTFGFSLSGTSQYIISHSYYLAFPFIFWLLKEKFTPRKDFYANYNRIHVNLFKIYSGVIQLFRTGAGGVWIQALQIFIKKPRRLAFVLSFGLMLAVLSNRFILLEPMPLIKSGTLLFFGFILLIFGSISYILVGQPFGNHGWATKNNALLALPLALIIFGGFNLFLKPIFITFFLFIIITTSVIYLNYVHLCLIALWVKNKSLLFNLGKIPSEQRFSIFSVCDQHPFQGASEGHPEHDIAYLVYMFEFLWKDVTRIGIYESIPRSVAYTPQEIKQMIHKSTIDYALQHIDPYGKQAQLIIKQGKLDLNEVKTAVRYIIIRCFYKNRNDHFLSGTTQIELIPLHAHVSR